MNQNLLIIGAGGHGKCCLDIALSMNMFDEIAFLDDNPNVSEVFGYKVLGVIHDLDQHLPRYSNIVVAVGNNMLRKQWLNKTKELGFYLVNLISPKACVSDLSEIGEGNVIFPFASIEANAKIGNGCILSTSSVVNHDTVMEDYCLIYTSSVVRPNAYIASLSRIGSQCCICSGTKLPAASDIKDGSIICSNEEYSFEIGV